jgi:hypothetical protein
VDEAAIREGLTVYSQDGKKLGRIISRDGDDLVIEKGLLSRKDYAATIDDVDRIEGDRVWLRQSAAEIERPPQEEDETGRARSQRAGGREPAVFTTEAGEADQRAAGAPEEDEVLLIEEELVVEVPDGGPGGLGAPGRSSTGRR